MGTSRPAPFKILFKDFADNFHQSPLGAALETLQTFVVPIVTPLSSFLRAFWVVLARIMEKGGPLATSVEMAIELVWIKTAQ